MGRKILVQKESKKAEARGSGRKGKGRLQNTWEKEKQF